MATPTAALRARRATLVTALKALRVSLPPEAAHRLSDASLQWLPPPPLGLLRLDEQVKELERQRARIDDERAKVEEERAKFVEEVERKLEHAERLWFGETV